MPHDKIQVGARISKDLYNTCITKYGNVTQAIVSGLELLCQKDDNICNTSENIISELKAQIELKDTTIQNLLTNKPNDKEILQLQFRIQDLQENQQARISDLKDQIQTLNDQITKKDKLLEELNQTLIAQASNIYNLTQNTKLLQEPNKSIWQKLKFWK